MSPTTKKTLLIGYSHEDLDFDFEQLFQEFNQENTALGIEIKTDDSSFHIDERIQFHQNQIEQIANKAKKLLDNSKVTLDDFIEDNYAAVDTKNLKIFKSLAHRVKTSLTEIILLTALQNNFSQNFYSINNPANSYQALESIAANSMEYNVLLVEKARIPELEKTLKPSSIIHSIFLSSKELNKTFFRSILKEAFRSLDNQSRMQVSMGIAKTMNPIDQQSTIPRASLSERHFKPVLGNSTNPESPENKKSIAGRMQNLFRSSKQGG